jgi:ABC-type transport system involved in cytochrome c biogenesis permease subunit
LSEELNSTMLYIHPPLAIIGYVFIFLFTFFLFQRKTKGKTTQLMGIAAWSLTLAGLITGMYWAQLAWGSFWSWDPKETLTLALFVALSTSMVTMFERHPTLAKWTAVLTCVLVILTSSSSFIISGLHSFLH